MIEMGNVSAGMSTEQIISAQKSDVNSEPLEYQDTKALNIQGTGKSRGA
jgi:hypothetical protein